MDDDYACHVRRMHAGEELASDIRFLSEHGLTQMVSLSGHNGDSVMDQVIQGVTEMAQEGCLQFPEWRPDDLPLPSDAPNREVRLKFHGLPFRFLQPGNSNASQGRRYLNVDATFNFQSLEVVKFFKRCERIKSPEDSNVALIYLCPFVLQSCKV